MERGRAEAAPNANASRALFDMTRALAVGESTGDVLPAICAALARDAEMDQDRLGADDAAERVAAWSHDRAQPWPPRSVAVLQRPAERGGRGETRGRSTARGGSRVASATSASGSRKPDARSVDLGVRPPSPGAGASSIGSSSQISVAQSLAHERLIEERRQPRSRDRATS